MTPTGAKWPIGAEITHMCPRDGETVMPCCGQTPFQVPRTDRITVQPELVTCNAGKDHAREEAEVRR